MNKHCKLTFVLLLVPICAFTSLQGAFGQTNRMPRTKSGFVTTPDGIRIHYLEAKPNPRMPTSPAILFVPGWTMPAWIWEPQIAYFSKTHRVVAMDPRSQGESTQTPEGLYPAARARDIKAVVDKLKLAPVVLVGWSMGVTELAAYVDQFGTTDVAGLVLVDGIAGSDFDPKMTPQMFKFAASIQEDRRKKTDGFVRFMYKKPQSEEYLQRVTAAALATPTNSAMALFLGTFTFDYRPALAKIDKPALIITAAGAANPRAAVYRDMQQRIANSRLENFPDAGHALFVDDPERFNSLLNNFLKDLPTQDGKK